MSSLDRPFVLLDEGRAGQRSCLLYHDCLDVIRCHRPEEVPACLDSMEAAHRRGLHLAGFFAYELGLLFEPTLARACPARTDQPLLWIGVFAPPVRLERPTDQLPDGDGAEISNVRFSMDKARYLDSFARIHDYIAAGDVYQINFTLKYLFDLTGSPLALYRELRRKQPVATGGLIAAEDLTVLSLSPELFLESDARRIFTRPMKGTAGRGRTPREDEGQRAWLREDEKSRAENLMIVDLLRNDLSRVAEFGSVSVPELFSVETYRSVHQMTSTVSARLRQDLRFSEILRALFPCGSITGAPKVRAMEIIHELETAPRGVYTGAIGRLDPDGGFRFNVAIRTLAIDASGRGEMGIGSGIVYDSEGESEFAECLLKAHFLTRQDKPFRLIETMRWDEASGFALLDRHLSRLDASAGYFGFTCVPSEIERELRRYAARHFGTGAFKLRLLLDEEGGLEFAHEPLMTEEDKEPCRYAVSQLRIDRHDPFLYHKTTRRQTYAEELRRAKTEFGCDEVIFINKEEEIMEGSYTNIFIERSGVLLTPAVECGLLDGTLRRHLLEGGGQPTREARLSLDDLMKADVVYLGNSVRGLVPALPVASTADVGVKC